MMLIDRIKTLFNVFVMKYNYSYSVIELICLF